MSLAPGIRLGPYEILAAIGAGGMGEVYKAKDARLDRMVAIKVLPEDLAKNPDALARFEREAKAVAALNHPNITGIFDIGHTEDTAYAVMELLEGESLRGRLLRGALTPRLAIELAVQMACGLAAAHDKGVIHRDLKPENLWVTKDGRLKILDFGLAKKVALVSRGSQSFLPTQAISPGLVAYTEEGMILGTMGYMSPEQVRGEAVDAHSDIFSFGLVLFEMLGGKKAFSRNTAAETMAAILKEDPPELVDSGKPIPVSLRRIVDHCLEKVPTRRFHDAHDLAFALENLSSTTSSSAPFVAPFAPTNRKTTRIWAALVALSILGAGFAGWALRHGRPAEPSYRQLTFHRGNLISSRFLPDGQGFLYSAAWDGKPAELFVSRMDGTGTHPLGMANTVVCAVNRQGEALVRLNGRVLALLPLDGGTPREILEGVRAADFGPDGKEIAAIYQPESGELRLDFPLGTKLFEEAGASMSTVRISPQGDRVALWIWEGGPFVSLALFDRQGRRTNLVKRLSPILPPNGLVWSRDGQELYFGHNDTLWAVDLQGRLRVLRQESTGLTPLDVSPGGSILLERHIVQGTSLVRQGGKDLDLSFSDMTELEALSSDGRQALLIGYGNSVGPEARVAIRRLDGSPPKFLGPGFALDQSPDGKWVILVPPGRTDQVQLVPTGPGVTRDLPVSRASLQTAFFTSNGRQILLLVRQSKGFNQWLRVPMEGGPLEVLPLKLQIPPAAIRFTSEDGSQILALDEQGRPTLFPLLGGDPKVLAPPLMGGEDILGWDGVNRLLVGRLGPSVKVDLIDLPSSKRSPWEVLGPTDSASVGVYPVRYSRDLKISGYSFRRMVTSDLFVAEGLK